MAYSPINPFDRICQQKMLIDGFIIGCDGSGTVVEVGSEADKSLIGKKVGLALNCWAKYVARTPGEDIINFFDDSVSLEVIACSSVNPLTSLAMLDYVERGNHKTVIQNAASS